MMLLGGICRKKRSDELIFTHTLTPFAAKWDNIEPVGEDGNFVEDAELKHCVSAEEKTENGATKSFEICGKFICRAGECDKGND